MNLHFSYQNRHRSVRAENYLRDGFKKIESIASQVNQASAELIHEPDGSNVVLLAIKSPKPYELVVSARHENLYAAMRQAVGKLKRKVVRIKGRLVSSRRKGTIKEMEPDDARSEEMESIDAGTVLAFEDARRRSFVNRSQEMSVRKSELRLLQIQVTQPPSRVDGLLAVKGLGPKRVEALRERCGISSIEQLETAARVKGLRGIPGFGPKIESMILRNLPPRLPEGRVVNS